MGVEYTRGVILNVSLIIVILVACLVAAAVFMSLTGVFGVGVRMGQSNAFRSVTEGELAAALFAAIGVAAVAFYVLRRRR